MCRMYGFLATDPTRLDCSLVSAQNALVVQSDRDQRGIRNADGWGIAHWPDSPPAILKSTQPAFADKQFVETATAVSSDAVIATWRGRGYVRRHAYQEFYAELQFNPRPKFLPWIRKAEVKPLDINYYIDDNTHEMQTLFTEFRPIGFATTSGEFIELNIQYLGENIVEDFEIADGIVISPDRYFFTRYEIQANSFSGRPIFGETAVSWAGFYDGTRTGFEGSITWRTGKHLSLSADLQRNWVSLPQGSFDVTELGGRANFAFSPKLFGSVFGQWNDEDNEALFNFRINWIPKPGTDFFFVITQGADTWQSRWVSKGTTMVSKLVWRFTF